VLLEPRGIEQVVDAQIGRDLGSDVERNAGVGLEDSRVPNEIVPDAWSAGRQSSIDLGNLGPIVPGPGSEIGGPERQVGVSAEVGDPGRARRDRDFRELVERDADIAARISTTQIEKAFDVKTQLKNIDRIFERVFGGKKK
jgi:hypothetical protein